MRKNILASSLVVAASTILLTAIAPACGGTANPGGFGGQGATGSTGSNGSNGSGDGGGGTQGATGPGGINLNSDGGSSSSSGSGADAGCATATAQATATEQPVYMLFVLDGSGSMAQDSKWTSATAAIDGVFSDMKTKADQGLGAGIIVFSDSSDPTAGNIFGTQGPYPTSVDVPIAFVDATQYTKLTGRIAPPDQPSGGTPTGTAMTGAYGEETSYTPASPLGTGGKKVVILITDGVPTDNCAPSGNGTDDYTKNTCVMQAATELAAASGAIETFVIGTGALPTTDFTNYDPYFLGALAVAGGSAPTGCNPKENTAGATDLCYFNVDPTGSSTATQAAFEAAINAIRGKVVSLSCTFKLDVGDAGTIDPTKVNVVVNGMTIAQDPTNGWTYDNAMDPTEVILHGTACADVTATATATVSIELGCATDVTPPK